MEQPKQPLTDTSPMPFGKYEGKRMIDVPAHYLLWLFDNGVQPGTVRDYIIDNMAGLKKEAGKR